MALEPNNPQANLNFRASSISTRKSQQINYGPICLTEVGFSPIQDSFDGTPHFEFPGIQHMVCKRALCFFFFLIKQLLTRVLHTLTSTS